MLALHRGHGHALCALASSASWPDTGDARGGEVGAAAGSDSGTLWAVPGAWTRGVCTSELSELARHG